jgi:hypothetical protein
MIPREKKVTDYYAVEHITEYVPNVVQQKVVDYVQQERRVVESVPVERVQNVTTMQAVQRQVVHQPVEQT